METVLLHLRMVLGMQNLQPIVVIFLVTMLYQIIHEQKAEKLKIQHEQKLEKLKGYVQDSGEGRWMVVDAIEKDVPVATLTTALFTRFRSRQEESFAEKMLAALRNAFGGHAVRR